MRFNFGKALEYVFRTAAVVNDSINSMRQNQVPVPEPLEKLDTSLQKATAITIIGPTQQKINEFYDRAREHDWDVKLVAVDAGGEVADELIQSDEERDAVDSFFDTAFG